LVDSDARSLRVMEVSLKKAGLAVTTASSAAEALQIALRTTPEVVVLDTQLPDTDGFELCRRLRSDGRTSRCSVIFLSADARAETKVKGINAGADDFLAKPVLIMEIVTRVRALLEKRETDAIARRERTGNLSGTLSNMAVVDLLQLMETGQKSGIVHLSSDSERSGGFVVDGEQRGTIYFRDGHVVDAHVGKLSGANAVYRMLMWNDGVFEIEFKPLTRDDVVRTSTQVLLLEGMRRIDDWSRIEGLLPPLTSKLSVDFARLGSRYGDLPEGLRPVIHLFDGKRTIFEVVDECGLDDSNVLSWIAELYREGVLFQGSRQSAPAVSVKSADVVSVEQWLSQPQAPARTGPSAPASAHAPLPSVLARVAIPSPQTASEIFGRTMSEAEGTSNAPIPLTSPIRERTPVPEPISEDSILLSRNTVPANQVVLLTQPTRSPSGAANDPIPLTTPSQVAPRLKIQRMSSVVAKLPELGAWAGETIQPAALPSKFTSPPDADDWDPIKVESDATRPSPDNDPTLTDAPRSAVARAPSFPAPERVPVRGPSLIVARTQPPPAPSSSASWPPAPQGSAAPVPPAAWPIVASGPTPSGEYPRPPTPPGWPGVVTAPIRSDSWPPAQAASPAPAALATPISKAVPPPAALPNPPSATIAPRPRAPTPIAARPETLSGSWMKTTPPPKPGPGSTSGLHDSFFDREADLDEGTGRWKQILLVLAIAAAIAVVVSLRLGGKQQVVKAPLPPSKRSLAKKAAGWPNADDSAIRMNEGEASKAPPGAQTPASTTPPPSVQAPAAPPSAVPPPVQAAPPPTPIPATPPPAPKSPPLEAAAPKASPTPPAPAAQAKEPPKPAPTATAEEAKKLLGDAEALLRNDKLKDAEKQFRAVVANDPNLADGHSGLAMALYGLEKDGPAGIEARKAIALNAAAARAHLVIGLIASNKQDIATAKKAYKRYLELEPKGEYADEVRRFLSAQR
jgi:CheY-like chemotaxis protein